MKESEHIKLNKIKKLDFATFDGKDYYFLDIERVLFDDRFTVDEKTGQIKFNP